MTGGLAEIEGRIEVVRQLAGVISAMRGVAAARAQEAESALDGVRAHAGAVGRAIGRALAARRQPPLARPPSGPPAVVVFSADQGFAGGFSRKLIEVARAEFPNAALLVIGDRGVMAARERGLEPRWSRGAIASLEHAGPLANAVTDALARTLEREGCAGAALIHARPTGAPPLDVAIKRLLPFDFERFGAIESGPSPLANLPAEALLERLAAEHLFAEICEAAVLSHAAENQARMRAMLAAQDNVETKLEQLRAEARRRRQDEITAEIGELSASILSAPEAAASTGGAE